MVKSRPIGILDSGVGGLSIFKEIIKILPHESSIYFADSKNCPYGEKKISEIEQLTERIIHFLLFKKDCKLILIACNTITGSLINKFRKKYQVPFVGIEPATKVAVKQTLNGKIGILATKGTQKSELYNKTKSKFPKNVQINFQIGKGLVQLVEMADLFSQKTSHTLAPYIDSFNRDQVDQLVLGCTHYPFLINTIKTLLNKNTTIIDPSLAVARQVKSILEQEKLLNNIKTSVQHLFFTSGDYFHIDKLLPDINQSNFIVFKNYKINNQD